MDRRTLLQSAAALAAPKTGAANLSRHRNLFTGDSCVYFYNPELWHPEGLPFTGKAIHRFVDLLAASGVDTFLSNPNAQVAWYPSKKLQTVIDGYRRGDRDFFKGHAKAVLIPPEKMEAYLDYQVSFFNLYLDLADAGVDWLAETTKACRRAGISPWVSVRLNDMHGARNPEGSHFNCALFKKKEFRLSGRYPDPADGLNDYWEGLNYAKKEVRDFTLSHVREYVEDYDFEGLELDWLRDPHCLEPGASQQGIDLITSWIADIRALTKARGRKLGKAYPMGMRIPGNLGYLKSRGIDVAAICRQGLVDFLSFSNHWQTTWDMPYDGLRKQLGPDVVFYGVVENAPNWIRATSPKFDNKAVDPTGAPFNLGGIRYMAASPQMLWANAAGKLAMGVHGIEQFNFFCTDQPKIPGLRAQYPALKGIHDLKALRGKEKHYCLSTPSGNNSTLWELPEQLPVTLGPKERREFRLSMCGEPGGRMVVQVLLAKDVENARIGVSVNGSWPIYEKKATQSMLFPVGPYTDHMPGTVAYNFEARLDLIRDGWNTFTVTNNTKRPAADIKILSVEIGVFA